MQERLLLEDLKTRAPDAVLSQQWAEQHLTVDRERTKALGYVRDLGEQRIGGQDHDPIKDLEIYIELVIRALEDGALYPS